MARTAAPLRKEKGSVLLLTALSLVVLMGIAGLAIDLSHAEVSKTRLQNLADALALSAAISLNKKESSTSITNIERYAQNYAATTTMPAFLQASGNNELNGYAGTGGVLNSSTLASDSTTFTFATVSTDLTTATWTAAGSATSASAGANFVRVSLPVASFSTWFAKIMGFNNMAVSASAVAGTVPIAPCNLSPIMMCASPTTPNQDCSTGSCYGYDVNTIYCLTPSIGGTAKNMNCAASDNSAWGAGNIGLADLSSIFPSLNSGAKSLGDALAKDPTLQNYCISATSGPITSISPKTGNNWGQVITGIQSLFNDTVISGDLSDTITGGQGSKKGDVTDGTGSNGVVFNSASPAQSSALTYLNWTKLNGFTTQPLPIDPVAGVKQIPTTGITPAFLSANGVPSPYDVYQSLSSKREPNVPAATSQFGQRIFNVPFVDCSNPPNGSSGSLTVVGFGCFFLTAEDQKNGPEEFLLGQFLGKCQSTGRANSTGNTGFYKVILYKDPLGGQS